MWLRLVPCTPTPSTPPFPGVEAAAGSVPCAGSARGVVGGPGLLKPQVNERPPSLDAGWTGEAFPPIGGAGAVLGLLLGLGFGPGSGGVVPAPFFRAGSGGVVPAAPGSFPPRLEDTLFRPVPAYANGSAFFHSLLRLHAGLDCPGGLRSAILVQPGSTSVPWPDPTALPSQAPQLTVAPRQIGQSSTRPQTSCSWPASFATHTLRGQHQHCWFQNRAPQKSAQRLITV